MRASAGHVVLELRPGGEVVGRQAELAPGAARVDAGPAQHVETLVGGEALGDVGRVGRCRPRGGGRRRGGRWRSAGPGVRGDLEVDARPSGAEPADQLGDQTFPLEVADAGDDRQPAMEVEASTSACRPQ